MATIKQFEKKTQQLNRLVSDIMAALDDTKKAIKAIEKAGYTFARPSWTKAKTAAQADKLWLTKQVNGDRQRDYIGTDPQRIQEALDRVERGKQFLVLSEQAERLENLLNGLHNQVKHIIDDGNYDFQSLKTTD